MAYFRAPEPGQLVRAVPGAGLDVPIWILGSSLFGAELAAGLGLPYAFASHFAPTKLADAVAVYRVRFRPSERLARPYVMLGVNVFAADSEAEAQLLMTSLQQAFVNLRRGRPAPLAPPVEGYRARMTEAERTMLDEALSCSVIGSKETVRRGLSEFATRNGADELMISSPIFDHTARLRSFEIVAPGFTSPREGPG
jgi:luciferase family oxidoreductase group 1